MNLSENYLAIRETVAEKIQNLAQTLGEFISTQSVYASKMYNLSDLLVTVQGYEQGRIDQSEAIDEILDSISEYNDGDIINITLPKTFASENSNGESIPGRLIFSKGYDALTEVSYFQVMLATINADDSINTTFDLVDIYIDPNDPVNTHFVCVDVLSKIETSEFNASISDICSGLTDTISTCQIVESMLNLYNDGKLSVSDLISKTSTIMDTTSSRASQVLNVISDNISVINTSPQSLLEVAKNLLSNFFNFSATDGVFSFPIDTYNVSTSIFVGWEAIIDVISGALSLVLSVVQPILGFAFALIGNGIEKVAEVITTNENSTPVYPSNADFVGFGQNVKRGYVYGIDGVDSYFNGSNQIIGFNNPLFSSIIYNNPKENSLHQVLYPVQEFIVPVLPVSAQGWYTLASIIGASGSKNIQYSWVPLTTNINQRQVSLSYGYSEPSSKAQRVRDLTSYMNWINNNPSSIWMPNSDNDDEELVKFATWLNYVALQMSIDDFSTEYTSVSATLCSDLIDQVTNKYSLSDIRDKDFMAKFSCLCLLIGKAIEDYPYVETEWASMSDYLNKIFINGLGTYPNYPLWLARCNMSWATLVNDALTEELLGADVYSHAFMNSNTVANTPFSVSYYSFGSKFNPSVVPPQFSLNIWVRLALTVGALVAVAVTGVILYAKVRKKAFANFSRLATRANQAYKDWTVTGSAESYKKWKWSALKGNVLGFIFHYGSIDSINGWVNSPSSNTDLTDKISELSGSTDGTVNVDLSTILHSIVGES